MRENRLYGMNFVLLCSFQAVATKRNHLLQIPPLHCKRKKTPPRLIHVLKWHTHPLPFGFSSIGKQVAKQTAVWKTLKRKHLEIVQEKLMTLNTSRLREKPWSFQLTQMLDVGSGSWLWEAAGIIFAQWYARLQKIYSSQSTIQQHIFGGVYTKFSDSLD